MSKKKSSARKAGGNSQDNKSAQASPQAPAQTAGVPVKKEKAKTAKKGKSSQNRTILISALAVVVIAAAVVTAVLLLRNDTPVIPSDNGTPTVPAHAEDVIIDEVEVYNITESSISARWKTNLPVKGNLIAKDIISNTSFSSFKDENLLTEHDATVAWLAQGMSYLLTVVAEDAAGGKAHFELPGTYTTLVPPAEMKLAEGDPAPAFKLASLTGEQVSLQDYAGKPVLLVFWDFNCGACRDELPYLQRVFETSSPDGPALLTVLKAGDAVLTEAYMKAGSFTFPVLLDGDSSITSSYTIVTFPTSFLLDKNGTILKIRQESFKSAGDVSDFIK